MFPEKRLGKESPRTRRDALVKKKLRKKRIYGCSGDSRAPTSLLSSLLKVLEIFTSCKVPKILVVTEWQYKIVSFSDVLR